MHHVITWRSFAHIFKGLLLFMSLFLHFCLLVGGYQRGGGWGDGQNK